MSQQKGAYIDLDSLLDARMGIIGQLNNDEAKRLMAGNYFRRTIDRFGSPRAGFSQEEYEALYRDRNVQSLHGSQLTRMTNEFTMFMLDVYNKLGQPMADVSYDVDVNLWPYNLNEDERYALKLILGKYFGQMVNVNLIHMDPASVTPAVVNIKYDLMITYDVNGWLTQHAESLLELPLLSVTLIGPRLYHTAPVSALKADQSKVEGVPLFNGIEMLFAPVISLRLIDVSYFSVLDPRAD